MIKKNLHWPLALFVAFVFLQSLVFKFTDAPETQLIFEGKLEPWAASLGFAGVFAKGGLLSAKVIGSFELIASVLLLLGLIRPRKPILLTSGAVLSLIIISSAILFHLFTPLGVVIQQAGGENDGGELFMLACAVWLASVLILYIQRKKTHSKVL